MNKKVLFLGGLLVIGAITSFGIYNKVNSVDYLREQVMYTICTKEQGIDVLGCQCAIMYMQEYLSENDYKKLLNHRLNGERVKAGKLFDKLSFREMIEIEQRVNSCIEILKSSNEEV